MNPAAAAALRQAAAHVLVDDLAAPALDDASSHHLGKVLRLRDGESVTVTDGRGGWRSCRMVAGAIEAVGEVDHVERRADPVSIGFAIPKHDRPEWIVQKLTELGVDRIVLLHAHRSVVHWSDDRAVKHVARLERVAREALQQSRQVWLPELVGPSPAIEWLRSAAVAEPGGRPFGPHDRTVAIGPEGGWSPEELDRAGDRIGLGMSILRVETAAILVAARAILHVE